MHVYKHSFRMDSESSYKQLETLLLCILNRLDFLTAQHTNNVEQKLLMNQLAERRRLALEEHRRRWETRNVSSPLEFDQKAA